MTRHAGSQPANAPLAARIPAGHQRDRIARLGPVKERRHEPRRPHVETDADERRGSKRHADAIFWLFVDLNAVCTARHPSLEKRVLSITWLTAI